MFLGSVKLAQRLIPAVKQGDLRRGPCGIRAQAISSRGELVDDFVFGMIYSYVVRVFLIFNFKNLYLPCVLSYM